MSKLKVGVIGVGGISDSHLQSYRNNPDVELVAVCDLSEERADRQAVKFGVPHRYTDYRKLLARQDLDAVSICTWNAVHAEISIAALEAGKHVLVEKPLCTTVEEALRIERAVRTSGKVLQVGFVRRYANNTRILKKFIDEGELGDIYYAKASCLRRIGNPGGWFSDKKRSGGGPLIDLGVHVIDLCWYLMGKPEVESVSGSVSYKLGSRTNVQHLSYYRAADADAQLDDVEDLASAIIKFRNGASLMVDVSFALHAAQDEMGVKLYGTKGGAQVEPELMLVSEKLNTILNVHPQVDSVKLNVGSAFQNEINHFVAVCLGQADPVSPVEDGIALMKMLCAIYESAETRREIRFDSIPAEEGVAYAGNQ